MKDTLKFTFAKDDEGKPRSEFYVNEEKRTVVCKIHGCLTGFSGEIENELVAACPATKVSFEDNFAIQSFTGKAKCCPGDKFDEKIGRQIAESRAKMKAYSCMYKIASEAAEFYKKQAAACEGAKDKYLGILSVESGRIQKLTD